MAASQWRKICWSLTVCGLIGAGVNWDGRRKLALARTFVPAPGRILSARVDEHLRPLSSSEKRKGKSTGTQKRRSWSVEFRYSYRVDGKDMEGHSYSLPDDRPSFSDEGSASEVARRFPAGQEVEVRVNPTDPTQAVLVVETDEPYEAYMAFFGFGAVLALLLSFFV